LEDLKKQGKVKDIGVSNFLKRHLEHLLQNCKEKPVLDQFEIHPLLFEKDLVDFCKKNQIIVEAYSSLARWDPLLMNNQTLLKVASSCKKTPA